MRLSTIRSIPINDARRPRRGLRSPAVSGFGAGFCPKFWPARYQANTLWPTRFAIARSCLILLDRERRGLTTSQSDLAEQLDLDKSNVANTWAQALQASQSKL